MNATLVKRFFKAHYGIPVRVENGKSFMRVWIMLDKRENFRAPMTYSYSFPEELGKHCMGIVYKGHQNWGGNIGAHSLGMHHDQWETLLAELALVEAVV